MKKCGYRNCELIVDDNKIYCCRGHKEDEKKYRNRAKNPKPLGRPKSVWKRITDLTDDDLKKLSQLNEFVEKVYTKKGL